MCARTVAIGLAFVFAFGTTANAAWPSPPKVGGTLGQIGKGGSDFVKDPVGTTKKSAPGKAATQQGQKLGTTAKSFGGIKGTNGLGGVASGIGGATGIKGTNGVAGIANGVGNATGIKGTNGVNGIGKATGIKGTNGVNGVTKGIGNATGVNGTNGVAGATKGINDATGIKGANAINGATKTLGNATGIQGTNGLNGVAKGMGNATGIRGTNGVAGATKGIGNATGIKGTNGLAGIANSVGSATGIRGTNGVTGIAKGARNSSPIKGTNGVAGIAKGVENATGIRGTNGIAGAGSAMGIKGTNGVAGVVKGTGNSLGIQGTNGIAGLKTRSILPGNGPRAASGFATKINPIGSVDVQQSLANLGNMQPPTIAGGAMGASNFIKTMKPIEMPDSLNVNIPSNPREVLQAAGEQATNAVQQVGHVAQDAAEQADALQQKVVDAQAKVEQAKAQWGEAQQAMKEARADYHKIIGGDREDLLEVLEERTGQKLPADLRKQFLETDLNTGITEFERATGVKVPQNVKDRVTQAQAIADAARTGKLSSMENAAGMESNRNDVQADKSKGWDNVAWGKEIDHEEYAKMAGAVGASVATGNAGPFMVYAKNWAREQYVALQESLTKEGNAALASQLNEQMLIDALQGAMQGQPVELPIKGVKIDVGLATYNNRVDVSAGVPEWTSKGLEVNQQGTTVSLPNTHQPYVRFKVEK